MKEHAKRWGGRKAVGKYLFERSKDEGGFSLIELVMYMIILAVLLGTAVIGFASMRTTSLLNNSSAQVKVGMDHALNIARNENQLVTMNFYNSGTAGHPNSYAFFRADGTQEVPAKGSSYYEEGGVYYIKLLNGDSGVTMAGNVSVVFNPQGTVLSVTPASVVVSYSGKSRTVSVSANGEVTY
jgi:type II secretory pathway pseudopilin PulG